MLTLLLIGMLTLVFNITPTNAEPRTWTVDDDGPADFSSIQEAVNSPIVVDGDTIFVKAGIYHEHVTIDKSISFIGENKSNTIIDGERTGNVIYVTANNVDISGFTIENGGNRYAGIKLSSNGDNITNNIIWNNWCGIILEHYSTYNAIASNSIMNNLNGISGELWSDSMIIGNTLKDNLLGIWIGPYSSRNTIAFNNIRNHWSEGISMWQSSYNTVVGNNITDNNQGGHWAGMVVGFSSYNQFFHNNIVNKGKQIDMHGEVVNTWDDGYPSGGNYWSDHVTVDGYSGVSQDELGSDGIVDEPYVIDMHNQDKYPLTEPWSTLTMIKTLISTIKFWNLHKGTENSLTSKLEGAMYLLDIGNKNGAIRKLMGFINQVEALRGKKLTDEQVDCLISEAQGIISLIKG